MDLYQTIQGFADFLAKYFLVLAAAGALAMALIELIKKVFEWRTRFHAQQITTWFNESPIKTSCDHKLRAYADLLHLCSGVTRDEGGALAQKLLSGKGIGGLRLRVGRPEAMFALELERIRAQLQEALDIALVSPSQFGDLFEFMTDAAKQDDRSDWLKLVDAQAAGPGSADTSKRRSELYGRLRQIGRRKIATFELLTGARWANRQQFLANIFGTAILAVAIAMNPPKSMNIGFALLFALLGGILAPVAKDILVALQKVRQKE